jgi:hypothetical protein
MDQREPEVYGLSGKRRFTARSQLREPHMTELDVEEKRARAGYLSGLENLNRYLSPAVVDGPRTGGEREASSTEELKRKKDE